MVWKKYQVLLNGKSWAIQLMMLVITCAAQHGEGGLLGCARSGTCLGPNRQSGGKGLVMHALLPVHFHAGPFIKCLTSWHFFQLLV